MKFNKIIFSLFVVAILSASINATEKSEPQKSQSSADEKGHKETEETIQLFRLIAEDTGKSIDMEKIRNLINSGKVNLNAILSAKYFTSKYCEYYPDFSPLILASQYQGKFEVVKLLVKAKADINLCLNGSYALRVAMQRGDKEVVKYLLDNGADINFQFDGKPLIEDVKMDVEMEKAKTFWDPEIAKMIIEHHEAEQKLLSTLLLIHKG